MTARRHSTRRRAAAGFTLLEVLVAVAILGLGLTAILSAQFSAVRAASHARYLNQAIGLLRCKMSEVEEQLGRDGFQQMDQSDSGVCCEGSEIENMSCAWRVEKPAFPEPDLGELDLDAKLDTSAIGKLAGGAASGPGKPGAPQGGLGDIAAALAPEGELGELAAGGIGGVASLVMGMVYPDLKRLFEASTRRITVVLSWTEGERQFDIELVQWVTQPQPGMGESLDELDAAGVDSGASGTGTTTPGSRSAGSRTAPRTGKVGAGGLR